MSGRQSGRQIWVSLPLFDPAIVRAMRAAGYQRRRAVRRFRSLIQAAAGQYAWGAGLDVTVRRHGEPMAHPRFGPGWTGEQIAALAFIVGQCSGQLVQELSVLTMRAAVAGELPTRGRYG